MDYSSLRDSTLGSGQDEEAVTVNTRALIDKVLARYSGEWTTLRELIQNAADASATKVVIRFETLPSHNVPTPQSIDASSRLKHIVSHHNLRRVLVSNNGQTFRENDWSRLKRIAEGNPDETKIGAFGVGFYSVFSECETPFVASGKESMAFYWKGNSLFTRKGTLPDDKSTETCFMLDYRSTTSPVPNLMSMCKFLSTSLTFVGLERIELWLDDWNLFRLSKKAAPATPVRIPKNVNTKTKEGMMRITEVESQNAQIDAVWINVVGWTRLETGKDASSDRHAHDSTSSGSSLRTFFSRLTGSATNNSAAKAAREDEAAQQAISDNIDGISRATVFIRISNVGIKTQVSRTFAAELERATKKPPPKSTKVAVLTSSYDETNASMSTLTGASSAKVAENILSVLPSKSGRIFIGFPTQQTTGILGHISAPSLIPTVERESIDLNARYVRTWNTELLGIAGIACRIAYTGEMSSIRQQLSSAQDQTGAISNEALKPVMPVAAHVLKQYTFREATPLPKAGSIIEESFWTCTSHGSIEILSSCGVLQSHEVRTASETLSFVSGIPLVPEVLESEAQDFISRLKSFGLLSEIMTTDIKKELEKRTINESQLEELLKWVAKQVKSNSMDVDVVKSLFSGTVVSNKSEHPQDAQPMLLILGDIKAFVNIARIPPDLPLPPYTIPYHFTKSINLPELRSFGWEELQIVPWLRYLTDTDFRKSLDGDQNISASPNFAARVLATISKGWDGLSQSSKTSIIAILVKETCIPTRLGMRRPADAYFQSVRLFDDLPILTNLNNVKDKFLKGLGVRKTIELNVIFERLMQDDRSEKSDHKPSWSHVDLIRYLVSVWNDIPEEDIALLKKTPLCPAEQENGRAKSTKQRFCVAELFEPKEALRELGLPVLQWPGHLNSYASDGKFLKLLGLRTYPSVPELVELLHQAGSGRNVERFEAGLRYLIENSYQNNYGAFDLTGVQTSFVPIMSKEKLHLVKPEQCFSDPSAEVLGYQIIRQDLRGHADKLGVRTNPPMFECAMRVIRQPPANNLRAKEVFGYLATRQTDILPNIAETLGSAAIVPIASRGALPQGPKTQYRLATPSACFLGDGTEFGEIFDYVDFGQEANLFLLKVGSKHEPTTTELTRMVIRDPSRILSTLGTDRYLGLLRKLHLNMTTLKRDKLLWKEMKKLPFLLAYNEKPIDLSGKQSQESKYDALEDAPSTYKDYILRTADQIVILDDYLSYAPFMQHVTVAPQEDSIEELYISLGARSISSLVEEEPRLGSRRSDQREAIHLQDLILERSRLFLHDQASDAIHHDVKWIEKNLEVQVVQSVSVRRSLKGHNVAHFEKRTATLSTSSRVKACLSVTPGYDTWDVSQVMVHILLDRPRPKDIVMFETLLNTSLQKLKTRGYNVDRILRKKAAEEARIVEQDKQRRREEEQRRAQQIINQPPKTLPPDTVEKAKNIPHHPDEENRIQKDMMPGSFHDPSEHDMSAQSGSGTKVSGGFFSQLTKQLGIGGETPMTQELQHFLGGNQAVADQMQNKPPDQDHPPPYSPYDPSQVRGQGKPEPVTAPSNVRQNLSSAIAASRAHGSNSLFSRPETKTVKEMTSYCDSHAAQNLKFTATASSGLKVFTDQNTVDAANFVSSNSVGIDHFASLLITIAGIFGIAKNTLHVYYDSSGNTVAFNSGGSIFCNFRYFAQLHLSGMDDSRSRAQAVVYWWVVLCHELAHNLVGDHSSNHSFYTEQFVVEYFPVAVSAITQIATQPFRSIEAST